MPSRILVSLIAFITSLLVAYFGIWLGLGGGNGPLSPANTQFALITGTIYGLLLLIVVNAMPFQNATKAKRRSWWVIGGAHVLIGGGLMIFVIIGAAV